MFRFALIGFSVVAALSLPGCKIVFEDDTAVEIPDGPEGDDARNAARIEETFEAQLLPFIRDNALSIQDFRRLVQEDIAAAGAAHANQGSGQGAAWNFPVTGEGVVIETNLESRARTVSLDIDGDAAIDAVVQLGPVVRGTAIRDAAPFYQFDDFRDQIEFAKLSRALNDRITVMIDVPDGDLVGTTVGFTGVVPIKKPDDPVLITPIDVRFGG